MAGQGKVAPLLQEEFAANTIQNKFNHNGFVVNHTCAGTYYSSYSQQMIRSDCTATGYGSNNQSQPSPFNVYEQHFPEFVGFYQDADSQHVFRDGQPRQQDEMLHVLHAVATTAAGDVSTRRARRVCGRGTNCGIRTLREMVVRTRRAPAHSLCVLLRLLFEFRTV